MVIRRAAREKTALPIIFMCLISFVNLLIISGFFNSENKLHLTLAEASIREVAAQTEVTDTPPAHEQLASSIAQSALHSNEYRAETNSDAPIFQKFLKANSLSANFVLPTIGHNFGKQHAHNGVDVATACGDLVYAADEGVIKEASMTGAWNGGYGNFVVVEHSGGLQTKYAHLKTVTKNMARVGDRVIPGDPIGFVGSTGESTGCHLHFEVSEGAVNPLVQ